MVSLFPRRLRDKFWPEPLPSSCIFENQAVLITGATAGLGRAAAIHFANLGAKVIMTSRTMVKGTAAKQHIEEQTGLVGQERIHVLELDMSRYSSCASLVQQLKEDNFSKGGLDVAVLNAGLINVDYEQSPEGWEQTVQVHTLSTTLLGLLLLDWMREKRDYKLRTPHLAFVTSRKHLLPDITSWPALAESEGILRHISDERNWELGQIDPNYSETKLLLSYAVEKLSQRALGTSGTPEVIVNTVCPGLVTTDLGRQIPKLSWAMQLWVPFYFSILGKSPDYGARTYVRAASTSVEENGKYVQSIYSEEEYARLKVANIESDTAVKVRELVWAEIAAELGNKVPAAAAVLSK